MMHELSVLIPVYNDDCRQQVEAVCRQLEAAGLDCYEVIVADDGSPDRSRTALCAQVAALPGVRFIPRDCNVGRAAIRNFLAAEARYDWLLFIDAELIPANDEFIRRYVDATADDADNHHILCGDYIVGHHNDNTNLRYRYEMDIAPQHTTDERRRRPYQHFHTANFLAPRAVMTAHPFDENFRRYGYEDVLFGKQLRQAGITIRHIDNPVVFAHYDTNSRFVSKTEEALLTLSDFRCALRGYSRMLTFAEGIHLPIVRGVIRLWHWLFGRLERRCLCGRHPNLTVFKLYKLGFFLSIRQ